ncbi:MAG: hypothetical protein M1814_004968 [Vezdaea aestivalis]|nr:MAG: hypothetical protein M1814_004968 [Vezdaea aestivalis]
MDAHAHLRSQGWSGPGHALQASTSSDAASAGLVRPLLAAKKVDNKGVGKKSFDATDRWWEQAYDRGLKALGDLGVDAPEKGMKTGVGAKSVGVEKEGDKMERMNAKRKRGPAANEDLYSIRQGTAKYTGTGALYGRFVKGEGLNGTISRATLRGGAGEPEVLRSKKRKRSKKSKKTKPPTEEDDDDVEMEDADVGEEQTKHTSESSKGAEDKQETSIEQEKAEQEVELLRQHKTDRRLRRAAAKDDIESSNENTPQQDGETEQEAEESSKKFHKTQKRKKRDPPAPLKADKKRRKAALDSVPPAQSTDSSAPSPPSSPALSPGPKPSSPITFQKPPKPSLNKPKLAIKPHPLEMVFKHTTNETSQSFSFFSNNADPETINEDSTLADATEAISAEATDKLTSEPYPVTPHTVVERRARSQRSAAPTPDTAAIGKFFPRDGPPAALAAGGLGPAAAAGFDGAEFEKVFWDQRGDTNRSWKGRRREVGKQARKMKNRKE